MSRRTHRTHAPFAHAPRFGWRAPRGPRLGLATVATALALWLLPHAVEAARAPVGKHYMVLEIEHLSWPPTMVARHSCFSFKKDRVCDHDNWCGSFVINEQLETGNRWWGLIGRRDRRDPVELILFGQTEGVGLRSSIGGTLIYDGFGVGNGGFLGLEAPRKKCLAFAAEEVEPPPDPVPPFPPPPPECIPRERCCKICSKGKACGDACIARSNTCRVGPGCACNAADVC